MPVTDLQKANVFGRRVLGHIDFSVRILDFLETSVLRLTKARLTGLPNSEPDPGGWFTTVTAEDGAGAHTLTFVGGGGGVYGTDGTGEIIAVLNDDERITEVPFEDSGAVTYYLALRTCQVPQGIAVDTETGEKQYDYTYREIGHLAEPTAAAPSGGGIALDLGNHALDPSDDFTGRTAIVYLATPLAGSPAVAIETVTISGTTATTSGKLGQSVVSTDPTDYTVVIQGPTVTRFALDASSVGWAFIGTVVGGAKPRTYSTSGQVELASLEDLSAYAFRTQARGWLGTLPTITNTTTSISITTTGQLVVNGRLRNTPAAGPFGSLPANSDIWISWDDATGTFVRYTTWDTAFATGRVPLVWAKTDGSSHVGSIVKIGRLIEEYPETLTITVATDPSARAEFQNLRQAIAAARSYQKGSTLTPRAVVIELIGDVTIVNGPINETELFEVQYLTFRGRGRRWNGGGSRIIWSHLTGGLFVPNNVAITLTGWAFEDVTFRCAGTMTDARAAVVSVRDAASVGDLVFRNCLVDGSVLLSGAGGAGGSLPHFLYTESGALDATIQDCTVCTTDTMVYSTIDADGATLRVRGSTYVQAGTPVGVTLGGLIDLSPGPRGWRVVDSEFTAIGGPCVLFDQLDGGQFRGCKFFSSGADTPAIQFGQSEYGGITSLWLTDCEISSVYGGGAASTPVVVVRAGNSSGLPPGIFIHDNQISGDGDTTTAIGIRVATASDDLDGIQIHNNTITKVATGIAFLTVIGATTSPIVGQNYIVAGSAGIVLSDVDDPIVIGNFVDVTQNAGIGLDVNATSVLVGNAMQGVATTIGMDLDADGCVILGCQFEFDVTISGNSNIIGANEMAGPMTISGSSQKNILVANEVAGAVDLTTANSTIFVGDYFVGAITPPSSTHHDVIFDGVFIEDTNSLDLVHDRGTMSGCIVKSTGFSLNVSTSDLAVVGNHFSDTTPTDSGGTGNVLADNT
jgi:hypothetical protein